MSRSFINEDLKVVSDYFNNKGGKDSSLTEKGITIAGQRSAFHPDNADIFIMSDKFENPDMGLILPIKLKTVCLETLYATFKGEIVPDEVPVQYSIIYGIKNNPKKKCSGFGVVGLYGNDNQECIELRDIYDSNKVIFSIKLNESIKIELLALYCDIMKIDITRLL